MQNTKKGIEKNIFLRQFEDESGETLFEFFKSTRGCSFTIKIANKNEMCDFINNNGYKLVKAFA